ncbi:MAG: metallophosphoesterase [Desulfobacteraceae bacterium]|nr:metallophosphoesterase [Desulfobacteraceae bacterium]
MTRGLRILCVSDVVVPELYYEFNPLLFGRIDLLISCGDLPPEYLTFLSGSFGVPLLYIQGNHDIRYQTKPPAGCRDIHGHLVRHGSHRILGLSGSRWYNGGPNQYTERQMRKLLWGLQPKIWWNKGFDIVITHAPPRHIHDAEDLCHRGFKSYRSLIKWYRPRYFLHGHIHKHFENNDQRITRIGETKVINCFGSYILKVE